LIATDNTEDAHDVKRQLAYKYEDIFISLNPDTSVQDFESHQPDVLVLAFDTLAKSERYYLGLYRLGTVVHTHPHRTVILCGKDEVKRVYELCEKDYFDDYILFWPMTHDASRLAMAVHHAMRDLVAGNAAFAALELAAQARQLADLESILELNLDHGCIHEEAKSNVQINAWVQKFKQQCTPHVESVRAVKTTVENTPATILVVDDEELGRKLLGTVLTPENYALMFASSGIEAFGLLRKRRPDLILMDMMMPGVDGIETTRRIKSAAKFSAIPIIMVTCNSEKKRVTDCFAAGAVDFVVKPFNRGILLDKIRKLLARPESAITQQPE
jgi:CheY-like chemotaxis protein